MSAHSQILPEVQVRAAAVAKSAEPLQAAFSRGKSPFLDCETQHSLQKGDEKTLHHGDALLPHGLIIITNEQIFPRGICLPLIRT